MKPLFLFLLLTTLLETRTVGTAASDPLQKPTISLKPNSREFVRGESVEISCSADGSGDRFSLYRGDGSIDSKRPPAGSDTATFTVSNITAGKYSCQYSRKRPGYGYSLSPPSDGVEIIVKDSLRKPTISLKPDSRVFVREERPEISCSGNYPGSEFSLYRDGEFIRLQTAPGNSNTTTFTPSEIGAGNYWCRYNITIEGREFVSPESERVGVSVKDSLRKPTISLKPDSRVFVREESPEISCSGNYRGSKFSLYRDGEFITSQTAPGHVNTATFTPSEITTGNYWCQYNITIEGREVTSPESERVGINVWGCSAAQNTMRTINVLHICLTIVMSLVIMVLLFVECRPTRRDANRDRVVEATS
ncbi:osteoclast-associated immunoglobulin-like receptor isoform X2 [Callorhinchus milii]|uniref:osteoclast-associated immunoglobulin-like receptor isoform X2 n=1 Tax=Callorhinchus milii TaxID=7868 RepID=UPI001C3F5049|nr:osteoclast-associated immunoglobulin-like receptor isoform X2 [Callorhinchus milii]